MKKRLILTALMAGALAISGGGAAAQNEPAAPADKRISAEAALADIDLMEEAYQRIHPGYTRYASAEDMAAAWNSVRAEAAEGISVGDFYIAVQRALTAISCDHTKAELPRALADDRNKTPVYLPFKWTVIDGRGFITGVPEGSPFRLKDEIVSINARALSAIIEERAPLIPVDGYATWSRRSGIAQSLEFMGGAVDHFGALLEDVMPTVKVAVRRPDVGVVDIDAERMIYDDYKAIKEPDEAARNFKDAVTFKRIGERGAYLRVDSFVNYRIPVDPDEIYDPIFDALKDEGRDHLILDLRRNGGGSDDASGGLKRRLITKKHRFITEARVATIDHSGLEQYLSTWDDRVINPPRIAFKKNDDGTYSLRQFFDPALKAARPERNAFEGRLIILTSTDNSSGSTNLIAALKSLGRAELVGEKTGGSPTGTTAGVLVTLTAPNSKIKTRIPVFRYFNNVTGFKEGYGVTPDVAAPMRVEDFLAGRDPAYDKAISLIDG